MSLMILVTEARTVARFRRSLSMSSRRESKARDDVDRSWFLSQRRRVDRVDRPSSSGSSLHRQGSSTVLLSWSRHHTVENQEAEPK